MITPAQMYWLVKLDDMRHVLRCVMWLPIVLAVIVGILLFATLVTSCDADRETIKKASDDVWRGWCWFVFLLLSVVVLQFIIAFVPSTKQMAAIIVVPKIANSEKVQTVGNQLYDLAVEWMNELRPRKGEGVCNDSGHSK